MTIETLHVSSRPAAQPGSGIVDLLILCLFIGSVLFTFFLNKFSIASIPVRGLFAIAGIGLAILVRTQIIEDVISRQRFIYGLIGCAALTGFIVSLVNGGHPAAVARQILELHVQAALMLLLASVIVTLYGKKPILWVLTGAIIFTSIFAIGQGLGMSWAWGARSALGVFQNDVEGTLMKLAIQRPTGLSYSAVLLGSQTCLLMAAYWLTERWDDTNPAMIISSIWVKTMILLLVIIGINLVAGNRSPLLGVVIFGFVFLWIAAPKIALPLTVFCVGLYLVIPTLLELLVDMGIRAAETDDGSARGRAVLRAYGIALFVEQPFGYGLKFHAAEHWRGHWEDLRFIDNAKAIQGHALHNYFLNVLNKYGFLSLFAFAIILHKCIKYWYLAIVFIPYVVHIFFHNDGPLQGDVLIWVVLALLPGISVTSQPLTTLPALHTAQ